MAGTDGDGREIHVPTQEQLARVLGRVDRRTINRWLRAGAPSKTERGYSVDAWIAWLFDRRGALDGNGSDGETATAARRRFEIARADREQLRRDREAGQVMDVAGHERLVCALVKWMAGVFEALPAELVIRLGDLIRNRRAATKIIEAFCNEIRRDAAAGQHQGG